MDYVLSFVKYIVRKTYLSKALVELILALTQCIYIEIQFRR